ncbi:MAG: hypothetical protein RR500_06715 [Bacilli bacterium]
MKTIIAIISVIILTSCNSRIKSSNDILYIFPKEVNDQLSKYLINNDVKNTYLMVSNTQLGNFVVYVTYDYNLNHKYFTENTNRKVFINNKFYPVIFETDELFSQPENSDSVLHKIKNELPIRSVYSTYDNIFNITFDRNGKIVR